MLHITLKRKNNQLIICTLYQNAQACQLKICERQDSRQISSILQMEAYKIIYLHYTVRKQTLLSLIQETHHEMI